MKRLSLVILFAMIFLTSFAVAAPADVPRCGICHVLRIMYWTDNFGRFNTEYITYDDYTCDGQTSRVEYVDVNQ